MYVHKDARRGATRDKIHQNSTRLCASRPHAAAYAARFTSLAHMIRLRIKEIQGKNLFSEEDASSTTSGREPDQEWVRSNSMNTYLGILKMKKDLSGTLGYI